MVWFCFFNLQAGTKEKLEDLRVEHFKSHLSIRTVLHHFPGRHQADHKTTRSPHGKENHQPPGLC